MLSEDNFIVADLSHLPPGEIDLISRYTLYYSDLISKLGIFIQDSYRDESENYFFSVWQVTTRLLFDYTHYHSIILPMDEGVLFGDYYDCGMYRPDDDDDDEFWEKNFHYNVETGDISEILELVNRADKF